MWLNDIFLKYKLLNGMTLSLGFLIYYELQIVAMLGCQMALLIDYADFFLS